MVKLTVIDPETNSYPDLRKIALTEDWAKSLVWCDVDGFCLTEGGQLVLIDECGDFAYIPPGRFIVKLKLTGESGSVNAESVF